MRIELTLMPRRRIVRLDMTCGRGNDWMVGGRTIEPIPGRGDWLHSTFFTFFKDSYERRVSGLIYHHQVAGHDQDHGS